MNDHRHKICKDCVIVLIDDYGDKVISMTLFSTKDELDEQFESRVRKTCENLYQTFGIEADLYNFGEI